MKTAELIGVDLDYWVAQAGSVDAVMSDPYPNGSRSMVTYYSRDHDGRLGGRSYCPSEHWSDGGPIIEQENIWFERSNFTSSGNIFAYMKMDGTDDLVAQQYGDSYLVAAMRCYVASKFGDEVPQIESASNIQPEGGGNK